MLSAHPSLSACHAHAQSIVSTALAFARQRALDNATALVKAREFVSEVPPRIGRARASRAMHTGDVDGAVRVLAEHCGLATRAWLEATREEQRGVR